MISRRGREGDGYLACAEVKPHLERLPGYADRGILVRPPVVTGYRREAGR